MKTKPGKALVIGGGIGGIRSALDLAEFGYSVVLADKSKSIGGILSQLDHQFPSDGCGMCKMLPLVARDASSQYCLRKNFFHENIEIVTGVNLKDIKGEGGDFKVTFEKNQEVVDTSLCSGCGKCEDVCPVSISDSFNMNLSQRKAVYLPVPHNVPNTYSIDLTACSRCGECVKVCPTGAIEFPEERRGDFRVLVVDDELIVRDSLKELLIDEGFSAETAESGEVALSMIKEKEYHLLLVDIKMPGIDGVEVLKRAKDLFPELTIVLMTAYATIETAVEAMKIGALDYLLKPFDPEPFTHKILEIYHGLNSCDTFETEADSIIFATGTGFFDPKDSKNTFGYGILPDVITSREFERIISGTGPSGGNILRQSDKSPARKIAWFQCVGSRDVQTNSDFCSSACCMYAVKEARLAKEKTGFKIDTAIFYMDMRAFGKTFFDYQEEAEDKYGIRFIRSRVHSVTASKDGGLMVSYVDYEGNRLSEQFDLIVLAQGQRPKEDTEKISEIAGLKLNKWGFFKPEPFSHSMSNVPGIFYSGSSTGMADINESIVRAGSAAFYASEFMHQKGGTLSEVKIDASEIRDTSRENPSALIMVCTCGGDYISYDNELFLKEELLSDPEVSEVVFTDKACTKEGWKKLKEEIAGKKDINRILLGACLPLTYGRKDEELSSITGIEKNYIEITDIFTGSNVEERLNHIKAGLKKGYSYLKRIRPTYHPKVNSVQKALIIGGGIAGMTAALSAANMGFQVYLVEKDKELGGNLKWITKTIDGSSTDNIYRESVGKITDHPLVKIYADSYVTSSFGDAGNFFTTIHNEKEDKAETVDHGVVIVATGGREAETDSYNYNLSEKIITQKEFSSISDEEKVQINSVVMIQCVDSRERDKKSYCSRICCITALKNALSLKEKNPGAGVYILYRDIMSFGFYESFYTEARDKGVIFIQYSRDRKPEVSVDGNIPSVKVYEPVLGTDIDISTDLVVLSTGVKSNLPDELSSIFGFKKDKYGFFQSAESKWRPVDSIKEGIFSCGLSLSPKNINESMESARACVQRALRILGDSSINAGITTATVHNSLCSLCGACVTACPYGARTINEELEEIVINPLMCQGCGACAAACPNSASELSGYLDQQMFDIIDSVF